MPSRSVLLSLLLVSASASAESPELVVARGILRYQRGELEQAVRLLQRVRQEPGASHYLGLAQIRLGRLREGRSTLARAARLDPTNSRLLLDLGMAYLKEGNAAWAARTLRAARELDPDDGYVRYHLGLALLRLGNGQEALAELRAARHEPGLDWRAVRLQLGLGYYQNSQMALSRQMVGPLVGFGRFGEAAAQVVRAGYEVQGRPASWVDGELTVSGVVDSNPLYEHETTAPTAVGPGVSGSLTLRPYVGSRTLIWGSVAGSRVFYFPAGEEIDRYVGDASRTDLQGSAFLARCFDLEQGWLQLATGYSFGLVLLDGDPPLSDPNHIFVEQHGGHISLQHRDGGSVSSQLRYSLTREDYADLPRSSWNNELGLEHSRALGARFRLLSWLVLRHELARSDDYHALVPGAGAGLSYLGPWALLFGLRLGYEHENHYRSANGRWGEQRMDNTLDVMAEVGRALVWGTRLRAVYRRLQNFSTVPDFDYGRHLVTLNLSWSSR